MFFYQNYGRGKFNNINKNDIMYLQMHDTISVMSNS